MNILLFIPDKDQNVGGIFQYINCFIDLVGKADNKNNYYLFLRNNTSLFTHFSSKYNNIICIPETESGNKSSLYTLKDKLLKAINILTKKIHLSVEIKTPSSLDKIIEKYKIDIIHFPYQRFVKTNKPSITTMHDVQELYFPQYFSSSERAERAVNYKYCIDNATQVVVSYQHIKNDIIQYFNKPENEVEVILLNMENLWFEKFQTEEKHDKPNISESAETFLLYPAVTWQHKNHLNLLKAISYLKEEKSCNVKLICTGKKTPYFNTVLEPFIIKNKLEQQVTFKGIVTDEELYRLYNTCTGVVVPTKYEAGSFPLMESILMKIPVICSNVTSLPETIGSEDYIFDPDNIENIANKIKELYTSAVFREKCLEATAKQVNKLLNTNAIVNIMNIYDKLKK